MVPLHPLNDSLISPESLTTLDSELERSSRSSVSRLTCIVDVRGKDEAVDRLALW